MSCDRCEWQDAIDEAEEKAGALPDWKTDTIGFLESVAETILENRHVTDRQRAAIERVDVGDDQ